MIPRLRFVLTLCALLVTGAGTETIKAGWGNRPMPVDSLNKSPEPVVLPRPVIPPDTLHKLVVVDTLRKNLKRSDTVLVVKHAYEHREQIVTGGVIMACLVSILVIMNNYNPH